MTRTYLVVYEKTADCWGGFSPDVPGFGSAGDTLEEMRAQMLEGLEGHLAFMSDYGDALPEAISTSVDFSEETRTNGVEYCVVEWFEVRLPATSSVSAQQPALIATTHDQGHHG
jgi:predicted RNase H-like HicB family nuclease